MINWFLFSTRSIQFLLVIFYASFQYIYIYALFGFALAPFLFVLSVHAASKLMETGFAFLPVCKQLSFFLTIVGGRLFCSFRQTIFLLSKLPPLANCSDRIDVLCPVFSIFFNFCFWTSATD